MFLSQSLQLLRFLLVGLLSESATCSLFPRYSGRVAATCLFQVHLEPADGGTEIGNLSIGTLSRPLKPNFRRLLGLLEFVLEFRLRRRVLASQFPRQYQW